MQRCRGCGDGALRLAEDGLIVVLVALRGAVGAGDVRRQGEPARFAEGPAELIPGTVEAYPDRSSGVAFFYRGREILSPEDRQPVAGGQPPCVARERVPGAVGQGAVQRDADAGGPPHGPQLRRDHAGIVCHQQIAGAEQIRQIVDGPVAQGAGSYVKQAGGIAWNRRMLCYECFGQGEVVVADA